jgi:hypothetical protein
MISRPGKIERIGCNFADVRVHLLDGASGIRFTPS